MYKISKESVQKLVDINNLLNQIEIRGISNISIMYNSFGLLQQVLKSIDDENKVEEKPIVIDNTKGG